MINLAVGILFVFATTVAGVFLPMPAPDPSGMTLVVLLTILLGLSIYHAHLEQMHWSEREKHSTAWLAGSYTLTSGTLWFQNINQMTHGMWFLTPQSYYMIGGFVGTISILTFFLYTYRFADELRKEIARHKNQTFARNYL